MRQFIAFFALVILGCIAQGAAQDSASVAGVITDPSGAVVPNVVVTLFARDNSLRFKARTNQRGEYQFASVAPGEYLMEVEARHFAPAAAESVRVQRGKTSVLDIRIKLARVRTKVVVTSSSTARTVEEVSKALDTVDAEQIERRADFSLAEALRGVPGLRVQQQRGPGSLTTIQIRGLRSQDTAVLLDGVRLRDAADLEGSATPLMQDLMDVNTERIEILRGSGSSLYGSNAMGGVVNIVTDRGGGPPHGQLLAEGGGLGLLRGRARVGGGALDQRLSYSGGIAHLNVRDGIDGSDSFRNSSGHAFVGYHFTPSLSLGGRVLAADGFVQLNDNPFVPFDATGNLPLSGTIRATPLATEEQGKLGAGEAFDVGRANFASDPNDPDFRSSTSYFVGAVNLSQRISERASYRLGYQGIITGRNFQDGPGGVRFEPLFNNSSSFDGRIDTVEARTDLTLGRHNLFSLGYEFERERYDSPTRDENPDLAQHVDVRLEIEQRSHGAFFQDQLRLRDSRLQISLSGRVQSFNLTEPQFSGGPSPYSGISFEDPKSAYTGDGAISYFFTGAGTKLRAHVGNAYRAPSLFERFGSSFFRGSFSPFGDPTLRPERTIAFDAGVDQWLAQDRLRVSATYFYTGLQEIIFFDAVLKEELCKREDTDCPGGGIDFTPDPFGRFIGYRNTGGGLARGVELSVDAGATSQLDLTASYTYTNSDQRTSPVAGGDFFKSFGISDHMFTLTVAQRIGRRLSLVFDLFAASEYAAPLFTAGGSRAFLFDGPVKADLVVSYTVPLSESKSVRLYGKVENVFDRAYFEDGFRTPGAWGIAGLAFGF